MTEYTYKLHYSFHRQYSSQITQWVFHELSHERGINDFNCMLAWHRASFKMDQNFHEAILKKQPRNKKVFHLCSALASLGLPCLAANLFPRKKQWGFQSYSFGERTLMAAADSWMLFPAGGWLKCNEFASLSPERFLGGLNVYLKRWDLLKKVAFLHKPIYLKST